MKKTENAVSFLFSNRLENLSALLKNGVLDNMSNVDQLYDASAVYGHCGLYYFF